MRIPVPGQKEMSLPIKQKKGWPKEKESQLELAICHWLHIHKYFFWKQAQAGFFNSKKNIFQKHKNPYVKNGLPDIIVLLKNRFFVGLEVKVEGNYQTQSQKDFERELREKGGFYFVVRSIEDVERSLHAVEKELGLIH